MSNPNALCLGDIITLETADRSFLSVDVAGNLTWARSGNKSKFPSSFHNWSVST
jgi:hypothetical protein